MYSRFPSEQKVIIDTRINESIRKAEERCQRKQELAEAQKKELVESGSGWWGIWTILGFVAGFFVCCSKCDADTFGEALMPWLLCTVIGFIVGAIFNAFKSSAIREKEAEIRAEAESCKHEITKLKEAGIKEYIDYSDGFEAELQAKSVQFAESELAKTVIEWMTRGFCATIDAADRRKHISNIDVPFSFNVYREKIVCNLGVYDFEIERCSNLKNVLEQMALTKAIAAAIQLNITIKYPTDVSGTSVFCDIDYDYRSTFAIATIRYKAKNGGFEEVKQW